MPLAAPDYFAGANDPKRGANQLFTSAGWIRRRCNEITAETLLDALKIYDLAANCSSFRQEADKWMAAGEVTGVLEELALLTKTAAAADRAAATINSDYKALYAAAGVFLTWATANMPAAGQTLPAAAVVTVNRTWPSPDLTVTIVKTAAVTSQVATLRAIFV